MFSKFSLLQGGKAGSCHDLPSSTISTRRLHLYCMLLQVMSEMICRQLQAPTLRCLRT